MNGTATAAARGRPGTRCPSSVDEWLASLARARARSAPCSRPAREEQVRRGYGHTLREIAPAAASRGSRPPPACAGSLPLVEREPRRRRRPSSSRARAARSTPRSASPRACSAALGVPVSAVPAGLILTHPETCLPPTGPFLVVSLARSGNSPESRAVVDWLLESRPQARHLFITCNRDGALATSYRRPARRARRSSSTRRRTTAAS